MDRRLLPLPEPSVAGKCCGGQTEAGAFEKRFTCIRHAARFDVAAADHR
jgi:hypothetical protein